MKSLYFTLAAAAALGFVAAPAAAQETAQPGAKTEQVMIIKRDGAQSGEGGEHAIRRFRIEGDSAGHCTGQKDEVNEASSDGREHTRILLCSGNTQLSAAERADRLEKVLSRLEARNDLSTEQKAKVTTALREAIDRVRSGQ